MSPGKDQGGRQSHRPFLQEERTDQKGFAMHNLPFSAPSTRIFKFPSLKGSGLSPGLEMVNCQFPPGGEEELNNGEVGK